MAGQAAHTCPYFASRDAISQAEVCFDNVLEDYGYLLALQVVTLPYNLLLQQSAREALNINLENHIVVVDEAHSMWTYRYTWHNIHSAYDRPHLDTVIPLNGLPSDQDFGPLVDAVIPLPDEV